MVMMILSAGGLLVAGVKKAEALLVVAWLLGCLVAWLLVSRVRLDGCSGLKQVAAP
jgi:hypothetical protein